MSINISNFTVTADNSNIKEENRTTFDGVFIQSVSIIKITADISSSSRNLSRVMVLINNIAFDVKDINSSSYKYEIGYTLTDSYIGSNLNLEIIVQAFNTEGDMQSSQPQNITVYPYSKPKLIPLQDNPSISVYRADIDGSPNDEGTKAVISAQANTQITLNNVSLSPKVYIRYKNISASWSDILTPWNEINLPNNTQLVLADSFFTENAYNVQLKVEDKISSSEIYEFVLPSESITCDAAPGGKKYAIGGSASSLEEKTFGVYWKSKFFDEIDVKEKASFKKGIDVTGDAEFHDDVTIPTANITDANITNFNTLGDYVTKRGTFIGTIDPLMNNQNEDLASFRLAMYKIWSDFYSGTEWDSLIKPQQIVWNYCLWKSGQIELNVSAPFVHFRVAQYRYNDTIFNASNIEEYIKNNENETYGLILQEIKKVLLRNYPIICGRNREFEQYNMPEIVYPSEVKFESIPAEFANFYASINPSWLSIQNANSGNSRTQSQKYALITANTGIYNNTHVDTESNIETEIYYFQGFIKLFVKGKGTIDLQEE